jgi:anti-anti-sigma factor
MKINQEISLEETVKDIDFPITDNEEITPPDEDEEIISKSRFIKSTPATKFSDDKSIEHLNYSGIEIININLSRATMDMATNFNNFLNEVINKNNIKVVVNLAYCDYLDSSFLGALVNGVKKARKQEGDLKIVYHNLNEYSMFSLTKMDNIFQIFTRLKDAVDSYSK